LVRIIVVAAAIAVLALAVASVKIVTKDAVAVAGEGDQLRLLTPGVHLIKPFGALRRYPLNPRYAFEGRRSLAVPLAGGRRAGVDAVLSGRLDASKVLDLDRRMGGAVAEKLLRPLLVRELSRALAEGPAGGGDLDSLGLAMTDAVNRATAPLGLNLEAIELLNLSFASALPKDLARAEGSKVLIVGLDGYDWKVAQLVSRSRPLPAIERMRREGASGDLRSIEPLVSPLEWTTIATGVTPDVHGVTDFLVKDEATGEEIPATSTMRRVPAIWNMASLVGEGTGLVGWLATYPAEHVNGFIVSDRLAYHMFDPAWFKSPAGTPTEGLTYPPGLLDEIKGLLVEPKDVGSEMAAYVRGPIGPLSDSFNPDDPISDLRLIISGYRTYENVFDELYPAYRPDLGGVYFEFTDSACHLFMRYMAPPMAGVSADEERRFGGGVAATYAEADRILGEILGAVDDSTIVVVVSDHGFKSGDTRPASDSRIGHGQAIPWHRLDGVIAMRGPHVKTGHEIVGAGVLDVAPTVLYLLGLPVDKSMPGRVLLDALDEGWTAAHPVRFTAAYDSLLPAATARAAASPADQALKEKLASLGYVAGGSTSLVNMANFYQKNGRFAEAIDVWKKLLEENPGDLGARIGISNAYFEVGEADSAIAGLSSVLKSDPRNAEALRSLASIYVRRGMGQDALRVADNALAIDPADGGSHFNRGLALELLGRTEEAASEYRLAVKYAPDLAEAHVNLAQIYLGTGFKRDALAEAEKAVDLASDKPEMHFMLGRALEENGRPDEALAQFDESIRLDRGFTVAYIGAANVLLAGGKPDSAIAVCAEALGTATQYKQYLHNIEGLAYLNLRDMGRAEREFRSAVEADQAFAPARIGLARVYVQTGRVPNARKELAAVLAADPANAEARSLLAEIGR